MSVLDDITVQLSIVLGSTHLPIGQLLKMSRGAMIPLDCGQDDPTLVYVNEKLVAQGTVLVVEDQILLEITHIMRKGSH